MTEFDQNDRPTPKCAPHANNLYTTTLNASPYTKLAFKVENGSSVPARIKTAGKWQKCNLVSRMASVASNMGWL